MDGRRTFFGALGAAVALAAGGARAATPPSWQSIADNLDIRQLFARYAAAVIRRDGPAVEAFYAPGAWIRNFSNRAGDRTPGAGPLRASEIGAFVSRAYHPYHPGMWSHILHTDEVVEPQGDHASYAAQVLYLNTYTLAPDGAPLRRPDLFGDQHAGEVTPTNCAIWEADLVRIGRAWKIAELRIIVDLPYVASA